MSGLFDPKNDLWRTVSTMTDVCGLSFLWAAACVPVVTIGPATAALYFAVVRRVRRREDGAFKAFFHSFRMNFKQGVLATLMVLVPAFFLQLGWRLCRMAAASISYGYAVLAGYSLLMLLPLGALMFLFPLLGRFSFSLKDLFAMASRLTLAHLPHRSAAGGDQWGGSLVSSLLLEKVFRRYAPELEEEEAAEEDLGI